MSAILIVIYLICGVYMLMNFSHDIQMLQQNSYRPERYMRWLKSDYMSVWRLIDLAMLFMLFSTLVTPPAAAIVIAVVALCKCVAISRRKSKKPLVYTKRVWRIYSVTAVLALAVYFIGLAFGYGLISFDGVSMVGVRIPLGALLLITIFSWVFVLVALTILKPVEAAINRRYYNEARNMLKSMPDLKVIGITGSFGKTSTKHYLHAILSEQFETLMTPGSFNTPMGVIRTVREMLKPYHQIFICEMGAKQIGDIKEICDLVDPQMGILTAVGPMHLESFGSMQNVQRTKFELIDALPSDGLAVINNDFELIASRPVNNVKAIRYAVSNHQGADCYAENIEYSHAGSKFDVVFADGIRHTFTTKLVGECNISNLVAAIAIARNLGMELRNIALAVSRIEQVEHRLNVKRTPGGVTIIDDAFNSNTFGARMALDVLAGMRGGKRIVVTPGMIELGDKQFELNKKLGEDIATRVDVAIVVGKFNREAITEGIREGGLDAESVYTVDSFAEAQKLLGTLMQSGDTVLYENDLPDTFK